MAQELLVTSSQSGQKLFNFLRRSLNAENNEIHRWIRTGQVRINKKRAKAFDIVQEGDLIRIPPFAQNHAQPQNTNNTEALKQNFSAPPKNALPFSIVFENEYMLVINKPAGIACQGGTGQKENIADILKDYYCHADFIPAPAHRLDKDTQGLLLIGKTYQSLRFLTDYMKGNEENLLQAIQSPPKKIYRAWMYGDITVFAKENPYLCHSLYHSEPQKKENVLQTFSYKIPQEIENHIKEHGLIQNTPTGEKALFACSVLKVLEVKNNKNQAKSLAEIGIYTGRKHQIRVQLAHAGFPLVGDSKYAPKKLLAPNDNFFLQCHTITLPENPYTEQTVFTL